MRTAFVTGATGFIGRHLVSGLLDQGYEVRCLVRNHSRAAHLRRDGVRAIFDENAAGRADHGKRLWALLNLEMWLRKYAD